MLKIAFLVLYFALLEVQCHSIEECSKVKQGNVMKLQTLEKFAKVSVPVLEGKHKGEAGRIGVIGGSIEYSGAPYFSALSSLKMGADLVYVITKDSAAPIIKSYSPDLMVYPYLHYNHMDKINALLTKIDLVIIGPGLGRDNDTIKLTSEIIKSCKELQKPLVIDADGLYVVSKNPSVLEGYLRPGVILTPNISELQRLMNHLRVNSTAEIINILGPYVSILTKGQYDEFTSIHSEYSWKFSFGGSGRRADGQGDILSGILGTFFNWSLWKKLCDNDTSDNLAASVASYVAAIMTKSCNEKAFLKLGRSMLASDMLNEIHGAFERVLLKETN